MAVLCRKTTVNIQMKRLGVLHLRCSTDGNQKWDRRRQRVKVQAEEKIDRGSGLKGD